MEKISTRGGSECGNGRLATNGCGWSVTTFCRGREKETKYNTLPQLELRKAIDELKSISVWKIN